jgi:hypothetical protein
MRNAIAIEQFERRLIELGCPARRLRSSVQELEDHYQDLQAAALAEGCSESEAASRASLALGHPVVLAEQLVLGLRRASWWGRHPIIGFCVLPLFSLVLIWLGFLGMLVGIGWFWGWLLGPAYRLDQSVISALQSDPVFFNGVAKPLILGTEAVSAIFLTAGFCWLAWRAALGWKWVMATCGASGLACLFCYLWIQPHNLTIGISWHQPHWPLIFIPLTVAVAVFLRQRTLENRLPPIHRTLHHAISTRPSLWERLYDGFRTPTYWITTLLVAMLLWAVSLRLAETRHSAARRTQLIKFIRPAERAATLAQLKARQQTDAGGHETMIDLKPWLNMALDTDTGGLLRMKGNNLASCPGGVHIFAGVPFEVAGRAQLFGRDMTAIAKLFPARIRNIVIGARCDRLHLLHGACDVSTQGQAVARLVLHYADDSMAEIPIIAGEHLQDWWGPIYNTDSGAGRYTTDPGTELAWAGSNPAIHKHAPDFSLRLYRSTFANPHPELEIKTIDYVSTLTQSAPFMVGLTLETFAP